MTTALNAQDRCDSCGSQALLAAKVNGVWLMFCGHHAGKYEDNLRKVAEDWHDERDETNSYLPSLTRMPEPTTVDS